MNSFAAWGLTVLGLATVTTVAEMLLPQGKLRKVVRSVVATVTALVIVTPLPSLLKNGFDFDFAADAVETDADYLDYVENAKNEIIAKSVCDHLKSKGYGSGYTLTVETDGYDVKSVTINFSQSGITENGEHINKSEIIELIADYLRIGEEAIMTYG